MVNEDGAQQSTVIERLIRLEVEVSALSQRMTDNNNLLLEANRQTNERITETNQRIAETNERISEAIRQTNELIIEANRQTNERITETNRQIDATNQATNTRLDNQMSELRREFRSEFHKLTYLILGTGAAIIAAMVATQLFA